MIGLTRRYPLIAALAVLTVALIGVVVVEFVSGASLRDRAASGSAPPAAVQTKLLPQIAAVNPDAEYAETGSRPLFTPTRRPAPAQAVAVNATSMVKGQFILTGVTIVGSNKIALLREKSSGRMVRVEQGKEVNGITVAQIEPEKVTLSQGGESEVVGMLVSKAAPVPGMPAAPSAAAAPAGPFAPSAGLFTPGQPNPAARGSQPSPQPTPGSIQPPGVPPAQPTPVDLNPLFGPRPGGLTPVPDPTTGQAPVAPLSPEELLARRRARRNQ